MRFVYSGNYGVIVFVLCIYFATNLLLFFEFATFKIAIYNGSMKITTYKISTFKALLSSLKLPKTMVVG
jgi:hypothetical protein